MTKSAYPTIGVAVFGANYWGSHLIRIFRKHSDRITVVDPDPKVRRKVRASYPGIRVYPHAEAIWNDTAIHAVAIASPSSTHFDLATRAIEANKHVFVEKPIALSSLHARRLVSLQKMHGVVLMVDHTYLYSNALVTLKEQMRKGGIGRIRGIESIRIGPGIIRDDTSVLWDLAPHDISIGMYLTGADPSRGGMTSLRSFPGSSDHTAFISLSFDRIPMTALLSWTSPTKLRQLTVYGSKGTLMASWDGPHESLCQYPVHHKGRPFGHARHIKIKSGEPLEGAVLHFLDCIHQNTTPRTDGVHALTVTRAIERLMETPHR